MARGLPVEKFDFCAKVGILVTKLTFECNTHYVKVQNRLSPKILQKFANGFLKNLCNAESKSANEISKF